MERRVFIKESALLAGTLPVFGQLNRLMADVSGSAAVSGPVQERFNAVLNWAKQQQWLSFIGQQLGLAIHTSDLQRALPDAALRTAFPDFSGHQLIQPGAPAQSLLFHVLAHPQIQPAMVTDYPSLEKLDAVENYIYALGDFLPDLNDTDKYMIGVFAYQYRPAYKTPHRAHADLVFSRTGVARAGELAINYDAKNRCYTNKPVDASDIEKIAVMPARYGLFIAEKVAYQNLAIISTKDKKKNDALDDDDDKNHQYYVPRRKLFRDDLQYPGLNFSFREQHESHKLAALFDYYRMHRTETAPFIRRSADLIAPDDLREKRDSFLVCPLAKALVHRASDPAGNFVNFQVPTEHNYTYFTSLETNNRIEVIEIYRDGKRVANNYANARNAPLFVNVRYRIKDGQLKRLDGDIDNDLETAISNGGYDTYLFEDGICDGFVTVNMNSSNALPAAFKQIKPAFSIVSAPDFFPLVDSFDLLDFDVPPGTGGRASNFYEGGLASLATARIPANGELKDQSSGLNAFPKDENPEIKRMVTAVISNQSQTTLPLHIADPTFSSFLPDVCSSVFAPGWDVTYASATDDPEIFLSTKGLGSPFPEDMKLCAASNGMWPVASPDAARTFQGSLTTEHPDYYANPTAVPLLDEELGFHGRSPQGIITGETFGWDGEQGPFLELTGTNEVMINFTDLGRADYVANAQSTPGFHSFNMARLRDLQASELRARMDCLRVCLKKVGYGSVALSPLWLVSAEKVNWGTTPPKGQGIPDKLVGNSKQWLTNVTPQVQGPGYLFVFCGWFKDDIPKRDPSSVRLARRQIPAQQVYICQAAMNAGGQWQVKKFDALRQRNAVNPVWS